MRTFSLLQTKKSQRFPSAALENFGRWTLEIVRILTKSRLRQIERQHWPTLVNICQIFTSATFWPHLGCSLAEFCQNSRKIKRIWLHSFYILSDIFPYMHIMQNWALRLQSAVKMQHSSWVPLEGHPDRLCDLLADGLLAACLETDPDSRVNVFLSLRLHLQISMPLIVSGSSSAIVIHLASSCSTCGFKYLSDSVKMYSSLARYQHWHAPRPVW